MEDAFILGQAIKDVGCMFACEVQCQRVLVEPDCQDVVERRSRREDLELHPTVKPIAMVADAICDVTRQGELVLDIFLGSGTSLIAAERVGRRFRGLDIDPAYVEVAIRRWTDLTGKKPRLMVREGHEIAA